MKVPSVLPRRSVGEWQFTSGRAYRAPFADVRVDGVFTSPSGTAFVMPGFYDGDGVWKLRFNPGEVGRWTWRATSVPHDPELAGEGSFEVSERETRGFLKATPGEAWASIMRMASRSSSLAIPSMICSAWPIAAATSRAS